jgi:NTE family protein
MAGGVPGFFRPNYIPAPFADPNSQEAGSLYNTQRLKPTLQRLVDFKFLNNPQSDSHVRLSLGATRVFGGVPVTFHSFEPPKPDPDDRRKPDPEDRRTEITAEHIMASGALAPWFPGVKIAEPEPPHAQRLYWDGGITSNSSFRHIIEHLPKSDERFGDKDVLIFVIDLWDAFDREPKTFDEVCWRIKQTQYSSRIEQDIEYAREFISSARRRTKEPSQEQIQRRAYFIGERRKKSGIPGDEASDWAQARKPPRIDIVRVSYVSHPNEIPYGDALFSRTEIERRFQDGYAVMLSKLQAKPNPWELDFANLSDKNQNYEEANVAVHLF